MIVDDKTDKLSFGEIAVGQCFRIKDKYYMKVSVEGDLDYMGYPTTEYYGVNLENGRCERINLDVLKINAKVVIDNV